MDFGYLTMELALRIPIVGGIRDYMSSILDSKPRQDSGFHKQKFPGFGNPDYLSCTG